MGGAMPKGMPMVVPSSDVMVDRDATPSEVEVVGRSSGSGGRVGVENQEDRTNVANLSDHELKEKIDRFNANLGSLWGRLPDKGVKYRMMLKELEEEQERRRRRRDSDTQSEDLEHNCAMSHNAASYGLQNQEKAFFSHAFPKTSFPSSFESLLSTRLGAKADNDIGNVSGAHASQTTGDSRNTEQNELDSCDGDRNYSARPISSSPNSNAPNGHKRRSSGCDHMDLASPNCFKLSTASCPVSKRTRSCKNRGREYWVWNQSENVVLLDDDDKLPAKQMVKGQEDAETKEAKTYYPSRDDEAFVEICFSDIKCLEPQSYLTSPIMNFYIRYLQFQSSLEARPMNEYHFFNTYFYKKLEEAVSCKVDKNASFSKLRRWLKGVNIFQKAYIFLPIHGDLHWSLVIICIPSKEDECGPIILHLDSLGYHSSNAIFGNIETYLREEWKHIYGNTSDEDIPIPQKMWDFFPRYIKRKKIMVPQQKNEYDCGLFVLYFMERFIEEAPERAKIKDLAKFGSKWFQPEEASELRKRLRELLLEEFSKQM